MKPDPFAHVPGLTRADLSTLEPSVQQLLIQLSQGPVPNYVQQLFPFPFVQYARILPRAQVNGAGAGGEGYSRWKQLATYIGTEFPATVAVRSFLEDGRDALRLHEIHVEPYIGQLDAITRQAFKEVLQDATAESVQAYFFLRGHSGLGLETNLLYRGPVALIQQIQGIDLPWVETPDMWWAEDGSWCVVTPQDSPSVYFGASHEIVQMILGDERIEGYSVAGTEIVEDWLAN